MLIEEIQSICSDLPGVTEDIKWENNLCFCVRDKMFLMISLDEAPPTASFKVSDDEFEEISCREGYRPAPYFARYKWVTLDDIDRLDHKEWIQHIHTAYELVKARLPQRVRKELQ